jgi:hypothetical protein
MMPVPAGVAEVVAFVASLALRAAAIHYDIQLGPRGAFVQIGRGKGPDSAE